MAKGASIHPAAAGAIGAAAGALGAVAAASIVDKGIRRKVVRVVGEVGHQAINSLRESDVVKKRGKILRKVRRAFPMRQQPRMVH